MYDNYDLSCFDKEEEIYTIALNLDTRNLDSKLIIKEEHKNIFVRGIFDRYGNVSRETFINNNLICELYFTYQINNSIFELIKNFHNIKCDIENNYIVYKDKNAFDFLSKIYDNSDARFRNEYNYKVYLEWNECITIPVCKFIKKDENALIPIKNRASEIGYNLTIIKKIENINNRTSIYDTGIQVFPQFGFYNKIIPKNCIIKSGYIFNGFSEDDTLKIILTKIDDIVKEIELPFECCYLILEKHFHYLIEEEILSLK